jgi:hypothetical protein
MGSVAVRPAAGDRAKPAWKSIPAKGRSGLDGGDSVAAFGRLKAQALPGAGPASNSGFKGTTSVGRFIWLNWMKVNVT